MRGGGCQARGRTEPARPCGAAAAPVAGGAEQACASAPAAGPQARPSPRGGRGDRVGVLTCGPARCGEERAGPGTRSPRDPPVAYWRSPAGLRVALLTASSRPRDVRGGGPGRRGRWAAAPPPPLPLRRQPGAAATCGGWGGAGRGGAPPARRRRRAVPPRRRSGAAVAVPFKGRGGGAPPARFLAHRKWGRGSAAGPAR